MKRSCNKKYVLCPGDVVSKKDGERHFISAAQLLDLYHVSLKDCFVCSDEKDLRGLCTSGMIFLYPRYDGNYKCPEES